MAAVALPAASHLSMVVPTIKRVHEGFVNRKSTSGYYFVGLDKNFSEATGGFRAKIVPINNTILTDISMAIKHIEDGFGLNRTQAAKALFVARMTPYNWIDGRSSPHQRNWARISFLNGVADYYARREPLNRVGKLKVMIGGISIYQLLLDETAQKEDFVTFIDQLSMPRDAAFHKVANAGAIKALKVKKTRPSFT